MPRTARASVGGFCYHVLNRGNARAEVFHQRHDYEAFLQILGEASVRIPMRLVAYCLMPNHFHLAVWPQDDGDLSRWMHWVLTVHVRRYLRCYHSSGHVWQGRFKAFPIQEDSHLLTVLRYIERNPLRAHLVERAVDWPWSSLSRTAEHPWLDVGPAPRGTDWVAGVEAAMTEAEERAIRRCVQRQTPYGSGDWVAQTAKELGLEFSLNARGRPPKAARPSNAE